MYHILFILVSIGGLLPPFGHYENATVKMGVQCMFLSIILTRQPQKLGTFLGSTSFTINKLSDLLLGAVSTKTK